MRGIIGILRRGAPIVGMVAGLLPCLALPGAAQQPTQAQQNAIRQSCRADYQANCSAVPTGGRAALACLQQNAASLSPPCRDSVMAVGGGATPPQASAPQASAPQASAPQASAPQAPPPPAMYAAPAAPPRPHMSPSAKMAMMREACGADYRRYCRGVRPGSGQAMQCLQANAAYLSGGCRHVLSQAGAR